MANGALVSPIHACNAFPVATDELLIKRLWVRTQPASPGQASDDQDKSTRSTHNEGLSLARRSSPAVSSSTLITPPSTSTNDELPNGVRTS